MKILFIENRYKTFTFETIANELIKDGHTISFLIQNKKFLPKGDFTNYIIPYPKSKNNSSYKKDDEVKKIIASDRMQNFFQKKDTDYFYYYNQKIQEILLHKKPDIVFGESTAFHELLTIKNCKENNILYLNPSSCRYPKNRFSFYMYDTLKPYRGSEEKLSEEKAFQIIDSIINRSQKPDYMKVIKKEKTKLLKDKFLKVKSYLRGDYYNTPNPFVKYKIEKQKKENIKEWDSFAVTDIDKKDSFIVLYPLQMQPEANIDVWGFKYRNQVNLIRQICNVLPDNVLLVVKPNPKSKYELSEAIIQYVKNNRKIIPLKHSVSMDGILSQIDLVTTVTGTIAIESILSNIPVVTFIKTINNEQENCRFIESVDRLPEVINDVKEDKFPKISKKQKLIFLNRLNQTSFEGRFSDPFSYNKLSSKSNMDNLLKAFNSVLT